jgi:hypothetical protein
VPRHAGIRHGSTVAGLALIAACGGSTPISPTAAIPATPAGVSAMRPSAVALGTFATAPDTATLKVTAPVAESPVDDVVLEDLRATLTVSSAMGQFVEAPDLRVGFAVEEVASDGMTSLFEAVDMPQSYPTTAYPVTAALTDNTRYRWRARALLDGAYGPWSAWASFRTPAPPPPAPAPAPPPADPQARYVAIFEADWSAATHPQDIPDNPHFSPMIGATHLEGTRFWQAGALASEGIERMAEQGSQSPLDAEIAAAQATGQAETLFRGGGLSPSPGLETVEFDITSAFPYVTLVTMLAPSPDWFVGVSGLPLMAGGAWRDEVVVELRPWDAGTDSGSSYESADADLVPPAPISALESEPVLVDGSVPPIGRFIFRRVP